MTKNNRAKRRGSQTPRSQRRPGANAYEALAAVDVGEAGKTVLMLPLLLAIYIEPCFLHSTSGRDERASYGSAISRSYFQ
jgi:hypothetical protein